MSLNNYNTRTYPTDKKQDHTLEQYKLYVESAERVTDRRSHVNTFYLSLTTALCGVIGFVKANEISHSAFIIIGLSIGGLLICTYWVSLLENYRKLNSEKFRVIHEIEDQLPLSLFKHEWQSLGKGNKSRLYKKMSNVEKYIPFIFCGLFIFMLVFELIIIRY